jgi:hypothetical protein
MFSPKKTIFFVMAKTAKKEIIFFGFPPAQNWPYPIPEIWAKNMYGCKGRKNALKSHTNI